MRLLPAATVLLLASAALAQAPTSTPSSATATGPAAEVQRAYAGYKKNILAAAEKMPADAYTYKPVEDIRTFARVINHVTEAQFRSCGTLNASMPIGRPPADTAEKATIVSALQASFAECDKAMASATDANLADMFPLGPNKRSRIGLLWGTASHDNEQYATIALYMRLKGIAPPSMER